MIKNLCGLVMCGGKSTRMGADKSRLTYFTKEQRYHVYDMLASFCKQVVLSCNALQADEIDTGYNIITDAENYNNIGPMGGLLSVMEACPCQDIVVVGCDYPLLTTEHISTFLDDKPAGAQTAAFYNSSENFYEPLLAYYGAGTFSLLKTRCQQGNLSLQHFLKETNGHRFTNINGNVIRSIDTPQQAAALRVTLQHQI